VAHLQEVATHITLTGSIVLAPFLAAPPNCCQVAEYPPPSSRPRVTPSLGRCVQSASGG
jgi:hypothetical protein